MESSECFVHQVPQEKEEIGERGETEKVRLCNLWGKLCVCKVCEEESQRNEEGCCISCGVWQGESYTLDQSETAAAELL